MSRAANRFRLTFYAKVLIPFIVTIVILVTFTLWTLNNRISRQFRADATQNLRSAHRIFNNLESMRMRHLMIRSTTLVNTPRFFAVAQTREANTIRRQLQDVIEELNCDYLSYRDTEGNVIASTARDPMIDSREWDQFGTAAAARALQGDPVPDQDRIADGIYRLAAMPVYVVDELIGVLIVAEKFTEASAKEFYNLTGCRVALFIGDDPVLSTVQMNDGGLLKDPTLQSVLQTLRTDNHAVRSGVIDGNHVLALSDAFDNMGKLPLGYTLVFSYEQTLQSLRDVQTLLLGAGLIGILLSSVILGLVIGRVTNPLRELRKSAEAVGRRDFTHKVNVVSSDELGDLADAFNQMVDNLDRSTNELQTTISTLKDTRAQLVQSDKLSALGEFIAGITHELNNPLSTIVGFSELLKEQHGEGKFKDDLGMIAEAALRCHKIVQNLLSFARQHAPQRKPVVIGEIIDATLNFMAYELRTSDVQISKASGRNIPAVMADPHQLQQVFLNLINNARQAIVETGRPGHIVIQTKSVDGRIVITVTDDGPGIPADRVPKVFDPFFTTKKAGVGTGLGLSVTYGIIKEHDGVITVDSTVGKGTTFEIQLPAISGEEYERACETAQELVAIDGRGRRILVLDDEVDLLTLVRKMLERDGFEVETFSDGQEALERLGRDGIDLILCDWRMPGMSGKTFFEALRDRHPATAARVVFMTGDVLNNEATAYMRDNGKRCITKPFSLEEFNLLLSELFG